MQQALSQNEVPRNSCSQRACSWEVFQNTCSALDSCPHQDRERISLSTVGKKDDKSESSESRSTKALLSTISLRRLEV